MRRALPLLVALLAPSLAWAGGTAAVPPIVPKGVDPKVSTNLTGLLASELDFSGAYDTVNEIPAPSSLNTSCLSSTSCLSGIAKGAGAEAVLAGSVGPGPDGLQVYLVLFEKGSIKTKRTFNVKADNSALADNAGKWIKEIVTGQAPAAAAAAEAPDAETFTADEGEDDFEFESGSKSSSKAAVKTRIDTSSSGRPRALSDDDDFEMDEDDGAAAARAKAEAEARAKAEAKARAEAEARAKAEAEARARAEAERRAREEAERRAEAERLRREEEARLAREEEERLAREEEERLAREEASRRAKAASASRAAPAPAAEEDVDFEFGSSAGLMIIEEEDEAEPSSRSGSSSSRTASSRSYEDEDRYERPSLDEDEELVDEDEDLLAEEEPEEEEDLDLDEDRPSRSASKSSTSSSRSSSASKSGSSSSKSASASRGGGTRSSSSRDLDEPSRGSKSSGKAEKPGIHVAGRVGYSNYYAFNFVTYGAELNIPVATSVAIVVGIEGYSTQRHIAEAPCATLMDAGEVPSCDPWNTILPINAGVVYKHPGKVVRPYGGLDFTATPYTAAFDLAWGGRLRGGSDFMLTDNFGLNVNVAVGYMASPEEGGLALTEKSVQNSGVIPQISAGTVIQF